MVSQTKSVDYRFKYSEPQRVIDLKTGVSDFRGSVVLMVVLWVLIFLSALYYVEQQVRLRNLNYNIIELKKQKKLLLEHHKTYQLQLHQLKRLDRIEQEMRKRGFVPVEEDQIRIVQ